LSSKTLWNNVSAGAKNFASATGLTATSDQTAQDGSANRALGFRQTSTVPSGGDPGVAFAFKIANTTGKTNLKLEFLLQSLDNSIGRTTTWTVDYGIGDNPTTFTTVTTTPASLTTSGTFASTAVTVNFPAALNNVSGPFWVRIVALTATSGSGSRPSTAVDDVKFSWN
jgi:trimeric autotransporter adhesin